MWRLKSVGHVGTGEATALLGQKDTGNRYMRELAFENLFEAGKISDPPEQELRGQLVRLAVEAFRQEEISRGRLIEIAKKLALRENVLSILRTRDIVVELIRERRRIRGSGR